MPAAPTRTSADADGIPAVGSPRFLDEVNKGPLEKRLDERQQDRSTWNPIPWRLVFTGMVIGLAFAVVNIYAALSVGLVVGGSFYVTYFIGIMARWKPGTINYVGGASTGASQVVIGLAFVLPALFFMSDRGSGSGAFTFDALPPPLLLAGYFLIGGLYGLVFFQFYRRLWVVEKPLPYPGGFDSTVELLALADTDRPGGRASAKQSIFVVTAAALISGFFVLLRDLRAFGQAGNKQPFLDDLLPVGAGRIYSEGVMPNLAEFRPMYNGLFYLDPFLGAIGWFVRTRIAFVLTLGALVTWVLPFFDGTTPAAFDAATCAGIGFGPACGDLFSWAGSRRTLAAGAILGAGLLSLFRLRSTLWQGAKGLLARFGVDAAEAGARRFLVPAAVLGGGWLLGSALLVAGGAHIGGALLVVPVGILLVAILGLIGVKVTGETSVQAVSPLTVLALLALLGVLQLTGFSGTQLFILGLGGAAFFATGLVVATDIFLDSKVALYVDNPPHRQALVQLAGMVPGILLGTALVWFLSGQIVDGTTTALSAPLAGVYSGLTTAFTGGEVNWTLFFIAAALGAFVELATGLGTAFGIGMVLQLFVPVTILAGAGLRAFYERWAHQEDAERLALVRIAGPTGVFVGASIAVLIVFVANQWLV